MSYSSIAVSVLMFWNGHLLSLTVIESVFVHHQGVLVREPASSDFRVSLPTPWHQVWPYNFICTADKNSLISTCFCSKGRSAKSKAAAMFTTDSICALPSSLSCCPE